MIRAHGTACSGGEEGRRASRCALRFPGDCPGDFPANCPGDFPGNCPGDFPANFPANCPGNCPGDFPANCPGDFPVTWEDSVQTLSSLADRDPGYSLKRRAWPVGATESHPRGRSAPASPHQELQRRGRPSTQASQLRRSFAEAPGPRPSSHHGQASAGDPATPSEPWTPRSESGFSSFQSPLPPATRNSWETALQADTAKLNGPCGTAGD